MPTFCRHNRLLQNCPICAREQDVELRPVVSPGGQRAQSAPAARPARATRSRPGAVGAGLRAPHGLTVTRLTRGAEDGYRSALAPGLRSGPDALRLADELAFAATRLTVLESHPPGLYAEVAAVDRSVEERTWLAFLIAYLGPLDGAEPFAGVQRARTSWQSGEEPALEAALVGPRGAQAASRGGRTIQAYRAWAARAGSQEMAFTGEPSWTPERRFDRVYERLALPGLDRGARFDLLTTLGRLGVYELRARALGLGGADPVTLAAKRVLGIGDPLLLERRAWELAAACELPLEALDLGFFNWEHGSRTTMGLATGVQPDDALVASARVGLGL